MRTSRRRNNAGSRLQALGEIFCKLEGCAVHGRLRQMGRGSQMCRKEMPDGHRCASRRLQPRGVELRAGANLACYSTTIASLARLHLPSLVCWIPATRLLLCGYFL